jgi:hypothetical protein
MDELEQLAKLDQDYQTQRTALLEAAKQQWLDKINPLIEQGKALGFNYGPLTTEAEDKPSAKPAPKTERNRRTADDINTLKQNILAHIKTDEKGMTARQVYNHFGLAKGDKDEHNFSNYIKAIVKDGHLKVITEEKGKNLAKSAIKYKWLSDMTKAS